MMKSKLIVCLVCLISLLTVVAGCYNLGTSSPAATATPGATAPPQTSSPSASPVAPRPGATSPAAPTSKATTAAPNVNVLDSSATEDFAKSITFKLRAQSPQNITRVTLSYNVDRITVAPVVNEVRIADFTPSTVAEVKWVWDMRRGGPPGGAKITYEWILDVSGGGRVRVGKNDFLYSDPRFDGKSSLTTGMVTLYWYGGDARFGQTLMDSAQDALKTLAENTGSQLTRPVKLYIYPSYNELRSALIFPQEWTGGVAFTEYGIISIGVTSDPGGLDYGKRTVAHELAHLVSYQVAFNAYGIDMPTWLNEGLSKYTEGAPMAEEKARLDQAIRQNQLFSVKTLSSSFSADTDAALLSYAESGSLVRFLIEKYGRDKMNAYFGLFRQGVAPEDGLKQVYGFDYEGLDAAWRASVGARPRAGALITRQLLFARASLPAYLIGAEA